MEKQFSQTSGSQDNGLVGEKWVGVCVFCEVYNIHIYQSGVEDSDRANGDVTNAQSARKMEQCVNECIVKCCNIFLKTFLMFLFFLLQLEPSGDDRFVSFKNPSYPVSPK